MRSHRAARYLRAALLPALALWGSGCARHMPVADIGERGGNIGVRVVTVAGEVVSGRLLVFDGEEIVVRVTRRETRDVSDRRFPLEEVASATVHRTRSESSWGPVVSTVVGVAGGLLIAAVVKASGP